MPKKDKDAEDDNADYASVNVEEVVANETTEE